MPKIAFSGPRDRRIRRAARDFIEAAGLSATPGNRLLWHSRGVPTAEKPTHIMIAIEVAIAAACEPELQALWAALERASNEHNAARRIVRAGNTH